MPDGPVAARIGAPPKILLGRYQLIEPIGEGGMGIVWRCFDLDLEEPVAIKFLREEVARDSTLRAWFRRETKLARRVTHPNVARVFDFGRDGDLFFLTMEFVPGESLQAVLQREHRLTCERALDVATGLCRGLAAAHAAGVVHGDIKPANILLSPERGAVLTDFGVARVLSEATLMPEESSGGTPLYMAPEQLMGGALTILSDVYAVGVLLFEALTGQLPWPAHDFLVLVEAKCLGADPDLQALAPALPRPWQELIADCLHRDPLERPTDARALLARLSAIRSPPDEMTAAVMTPRSAPTSTETTPLAASGEASLAQDRPEAPTPVPRSDEAGPARIAPPGRAPNVPPPNLLDDETASLHAQALAACHAMRIDVALRLHESALARSPTHPQLRLGHMLAQIAGVVLLRQPDPASLAALRASATALAGSHARLASAQLAVATLHCADNQPLSAARATRIALQSAPDMVTALVLSGSMLTETDSLEQAERRLELAGRLAPESVQVEVCRARLLAYQGRWDEFYGHALPRLEHMRFRSVHTVRLMLERPERTVLARLADDLQDNRDRLPTPLWRDAREVVAFALGREDRRVVFDRLAAAYPLALRSQHARDVTQILCEMACILGELDHARAYLVAIDAQMAIDRHWIDHCPSIAPLRVGSLFAGVCASIHARADAASAVLLG